MHCVSMIILQLKVASIDRVLGSIAISEVLQIHSVAPAASI